MTEQTSSESVERQKQQLLADLRHRVAQESDHMADNARQLAGRLAEIPRDRLDKTAVRNIENLAYSTDKVSDLTDLLKKLIGRDIGRQRWARGGVGQSLLSTLEGLRESANRIAGHLKQYEAVYDDDLPRRIHLRLCREYVRHLAANFEYLRVEKEVLR